MKRLAVGILAHVDAGKTTLSEAMLYAGGMIRHLGRVDKGDAFLDTYELEKKRGITIFSKQARLAWDDMDVTLLDTPGHVDFSAEMERVLQVLDYAVLVISGSDGVQGHTRTLWRLLARYQIPAFLFINKMDLAPGREQEVLRDLKESLGGNFVDFGADGTESFYEEAAAKRNWRNFWRRDRCLKMRSAAGLPAGICFRVILVRRSKIRAWKNLCAVWKNIRWNQCIRTNLGRKYLKLCATTRANA